MKDWKLHLAWASVAVLFSFSWGRVSVSDLHARRDARLRALEEHPGQRLVGDGLPVPSHPGPGSALPSQTPPIAAGTPGSPVLSPILAPIDRPTAEQIRRLLASKESGDLWRAYVSISRLPPGAEKLELTKALLSVEDEQIRSNALHLLQGEPYETALPILAEHLRTDPSVAVREVAAQVLGELGDPRSVDWLLKAYQSDTLEIQVKAAVALLGLGHPESAVELVPRLAAGLDHPDGAVRQKTTQQLGSLVVRATIPYLARALQDSSGDVRIWAIQGLHAFYTPDILPLIAPLAQDPVQDVAETARDVIRSVGKGEGK